MTLTWATIPREILYKILELLKDDSKTMIQLQLTCKKWHLVAQPIMYRAICLPPAKDPRASLLMESLQLAVKDYASKVMEIQLSKYSILDHNNLVQTIRLCPNVKCIEHDVNAPAIGNYYPILLRLYRQGYLRDLEKVGAPEFKYQIRDDNKIKDYIYLMLELKESAKQLYVSFNHPTDGPIPLIPALKEFKQLEEIIFEEVDSISFPHLDQVLRDEHPLLRKVTVSAVGFNPNGQDDTPTMTALPHIKVLRLYLYTCSSKDLNLVQIMFPALQVFYINNIIRSPFSFSNVSAEEYKANEEAMEAFFGYLSRTKTFDIGIGFFDANSLGHILRIASKQLRICSIAINVTPNLTTSTTLFKIFTSYEGHRNQQASHTKEEKTVCHVRVTVPVSKVSENSCQSLLKVLAEDVNPRSIKIEDYGENRKKYYYGHPYSFGYYYKTVFGNHIDYILTQFKNLKALRLSSMSLAMEASASPTVTKTLELEELEILNCKVPALFFEQLSRKINYIKTLNIGSTSVESVSLNGLSMPYTRLQNLRLDQNFKNCKLSIFLNASSTHLCFDADRLLKPGIYYSDPNVPTYPLRCISLSELETTSHQMLLRSKNGRIVIFQEIKF